MDEDVAHVLLHAAYGIEDVAVTMRDGLVLARLGLLLDRDGVVVGGLQ